MSIALPTIILIAFLAPGLFFRRSYFSDEFSQQYFKSSFTDLILSAIVPSILIHIILLWLLKRCYGIDVSVLAVLLSGTSESIEIEKAFRKIYIFTPQIIYFFGGEILFMVLFGFLTKFIVRKSKLDRKYSLFRFQNEWHYVFSGEILDYPLKAGDADEVELVYVDALVDSNTDGLIIYSGILNEYFLNKENGIDRIHLEQVSRRFLKDDPKNENGPKNNYVLPGELFIVPYQNIVNLHISYYSVNIESTDVSEEIENVNID